MAQSTYSKDIRGGKDVKASIQPGRDVNSNSTPTNNPFSRSNTLFESGSPSFISKSTALSVNGNVKERPSTKSSIWKGIGRVITSILCPELFKTGIFVTAVYSTALSILWFLIAVINPHWGNFISTSGLLTPSVASIIIAGFAKSIEVTFTTVMIVCLGQWLTKKARQRGVTMNDLQLRNMVLLPCALITQKGGFRALWQTKLLGFICVVAYIATNFYTTASDAVVSPRRSITPAAATNLSAYLQTSVANTFYIGQSCPSPPSSLHGANTCISTEHAGISFRNYLQYLTDWQLATGKGQSIDQYNKPAPIASFGGSVAVQGQWLFPTNYSALSKSYGRLVSGTQMAMPFAGIVNATTIPENKLSLGTQGGGQLNINAKAVSPAVGVICAVVTAEELVPIVYSNWSHPSTGPMSAGDFESVQRDATWRTNVTVFDKIFKFNDTTRHRPVFYSMPTLYNTEFDGEGTYRDMLYILLNSNISKSNAVDQSQYTLCGMNFTLMGGCSSVYMANNSGTSLMLNCQEQNQMTFPKDKVSFRSTSRDWVTVAAVWGRSVSLASGIIKGNAAMGSLLTQVAPTDSNFDSSQPSLADSLAILSAGTLLQSTVNAPFDGRWRFNSTVGGPNNILPMAVLQKFEAIVQVPDFSSGVTNDWKNIFVVVLLLVVILNIACLSYLIYLVLGGISYTRATGFKRLPPPGIEADITELRELFLVAIRSPAARFDDDPDADETIRWTYRDGQIKSMNSDSIA